jgi:hypothetical protein
MLSIGDKITYGNCEGNLILSLNEKTSPDTNFSNINYPGSYIVGVNLKPGSY